MDSEKVGKAIATLRKRLGYTQKDLALRIGISDKAVSKWERGVGMPDIAYLRKLAILLNTDAESLLAGNDAIQKNQWQGILALESSQIGYASRIYDKPLVFYLLGYFMLLGIRQILVLCQEEEKEELFNIVGDGSKLGVELQLSSLSLKDAVNEGLITGAHSMFVYDRTILYGVDQTRFFQRAMQYKDGFSLLAFPKHGDQLTHLICTDEERRIVRKGDTTNLKLSYDYSYIPFMFCDSKLLDNATSGENVEQFVSRLISNFDGHVEILDRGFVEIKLNDWSDVNEASTFVKIVQDKCGMEIYCIEEIAWRRGMISFEQFKNFADEYSGTQYGEYIKSLCIRYEKRHT